jgi:hypothetical protein
VTEGTEREQPTSGRSRQQVLELALLGLVVAAVLVIGLPQVVDSLRAGSVDLATLFYPALAAAFAGLAWSRRTGV